MSRLPSFLRPFVRSRRPALASANPGHDLAMVRVNRDRAPIRAKAREMRAALGLPAVPELEDRT